MTVVRFHPLRPLSLTQIVPLSHPGVVNTPTIPTFDLTALLADGRHFAEKRGDRIYIIDSLTGNSIVVYAETPAGVPTHFVERTENGVTSWVQEGLQPSAVDRATYVAFTPTIIHLMCSEIAEGKSITKLCGTKGYPTYPVLRRWARVHPWIDDELEKARRDRAEHFRDRVIAEAEEAASSKDPVIAAQLRVETYRWAASMDHERYNPKTKVEATLNTPTMIVVKTGIDRSIKEATPAPEQRDVVEVPDAKVPVEPPGVIPENMRKFDE